MPALPDVPKVLRFDYDWGIGEDLNGKCREFWRYSGSAPSSADLLTYATAIGGALTSTFTAAYDTATSLENIIITDLSSSTGGTALFSPNLAGTDTHGSLPADACALESLHVERRYRGGHPRIYWPWGTQNSLHDRQTFSTAAVTVFTDARTELVNAIVANVPSGTGTVGPVNVSYFEGFTVHTGTTGRARNVSTVRSVPLVDPITSRLFRGGVASQRKRLLSLA